MRSAWRLVKDMLDVGLCESIVQLDDAGVHLCRFLSSYADPEQVNLLGKGSGIGQSTVEGRLQVWLLAAAQHHHSARAAESANVGEEVEVIECDLERLHATHRKPGHGAMITVGDGPE